MNNIESSDDVLEELVELLDHVVREQLGNSLANRMQKIRSLALERRAGLAEAGTKLVEEFENLDLAEMESVIRWLSMFFDLANLTEEKLRIDVLRQRDVAAGREGKYRKESVGATIKTLFEQGMSASEMQGWLNRLKIEPVFTAHPSEAKRRTIRQLLRQIRQLIPSGKSEISESVRDELLSDLTVLWQSDFFRPGPPPVMNEVSRGVYFAHTLWHIVPKTFGELRQALNHFYPQTTFDIPRFLSFGSWIGGDRDGHPFVTAEVTRQSLGRLRRAAIDSHVNECHTLFNRIVVSDQQVSCAPGIRSSVEELASTDADFSEMVSHISESETYRRFIKLIEFRLTRSYQAGQRGGYHSANEFRTDLALLKSSLAANRGGRVVERFVQPWIDLANTFGFHFARLDIRQNSEEHRKCLSELLPLQFKDEAPADDRSFESREPIRVDTDRLDEKSREVFDTFQLIADELSTTGNPSIGCYVISMTHSADDVMNVLWLWKTAWLQKTGSMDNLPHLQIVPLFETIDDLRRSADILLDLLQNPTYQEYLSLQEEKSQMVMVGYSDSTKDGGYLSACWELHKAQVSLERVASGQNIGLSVFHGRGGALGRGGGPAARAIQSLPPRAVNGQFRVTEQGEVLSERYDDPNIAHRHLEQLICATLLVSASKNGILKDEWTTGMESMSTVAKSAYRKLIEHEGFLDYFDQSTPINEIETLPIGSRPARRGVRNSLDDLRAIPWTFAWTQSRHLLPAWYGLGTAFSDFVSNNDHNWERLQNMYLQWPMFRALIDNAELALAKTDTDIAKFYAELSTDQLSNEIWEMISREYLRSQGAILMIKNQRELLEEIGWLRRSVMKRNPYVDPLNLLQVKLIKELREDANNSSLLKLVRLTIQGVAAGLRTTG
ncbi:MAG: phosphoenolpyruvate carboxylase [Planctomycetota bacterium]|nr:phosphoenolpyruvate carboxylase [Planctomycetota bacterium]